MTIMEAIYIYLRGYQPHSLYTLEDWFKARDIYHSRPKEVMEAKNQVNKKK